MFTLQILLPVFFEGFQDYFLSRGDFIIGGDFNCVENSVDKFRSNNIHVTDKTSIVSLRSDFSLLDVSHKCTVPIRGHAISYLFVNW